ERGLGYGAARPRRALADGTPLVQETRHWDENRGVTSSMRSKEFAFDYRYFPEPDLSPLKPDAEWVEKIRVDLPELPAARRRRFRDEYGLEARQATLLAGEWAPFFEETVSLGADAKAAANWIVGDLAGLLHEHRADADGSAYP